MRTFIFLTLLFTVFSQANASIFSLGQGDLVGQITTTVVKPGKTLAQIARDNDMGYVEMEEANPSIADTVNMAPGTVLVVPSRFVLPNAPRNGIIINLAEMRLYYYPTGSNQVVTYPMGIGREGEDTPVGVMKIIQHIKNPTWMATEEMRKLRAKEGVILPKSVPPGPENPMGKFAMRLSKPTYLIHGTNDPLGGIGRRSSSGCMRLYPEDIESLFYKVHDGIPVYIVNEPYKAGWSAQGKLYLESHIPLTGDEQVKQDIARIRQVVELATKGHEANIDWDKTQEIAQETQGIPQVIGTAG